MKFYHIFLSASIGLFTGPLLASVQVAQRGAGREIQGRGENGFGNGELTSDRQDDPFQSKKKLRVI